MAQARYPALYEINTRVWLRELMRTQGRPVSLNDVPDGALDRLARLGFDWVWLMGVWQTGPLGRGVSRKQTDWRRGYEALLPDFTEDDVCGSPFAVQSYTVPAELGGGEALERLRERLRQRGIKLLLDFVPNHTALDHPWVEDWPDFYIQGDQVDLAREPGNYRLMLTNRGPLVLAYGRDPNFPGWPDSLQLNYRYPVLREAMIEELTKIAGCCDGVRCDMAMLLLPEIIQRTWGERSLPRDGTQPADAPFWPEAIGRVRRHFPDFLFMAEVYWDLEWELQQQGFDFTYDKKLYDRLKAGEAAGVRGHLWADHDFQRRCVRFLENHDELRAAHVFTLPQHRAAAVIAYFVPGLRFFHDGQLEGRRLHASLHLKRRPDEASDPNLEEFYARLLECLKRPEFRDGRWQLLECLSGWDGNTTWQRFLAYAWEGPNAQRVVVVVNYGPTRGQCHIRLPRGDLRGKRLLFRDLLGRTCYEHDSADLASRGLYLDLPEWGYRVLEVVNG
jgi:hypothetical protein